MDPSRVPRYTVADIERLAADLVKEKLGEPPTIPIDPDLLLELEPGVTLDILPGLQSRFGVQGVVYRLDRNELLVIIDQDLADHPNSHRYRFTVAEELGHVKLHGRVLLEIEDVPAAVRLMAHEVYHEMDRNARRFAAAVLMPASVVRAAARRLYPGLVDEFGFDVPEALLGQLAQALSLKFRGSMMTYSRSAHHPPDIRSVAAVQHFAEDDHVLPVLGPIGRLLGPDDVGETGREQLHPEDFEAHRAIDQILVSFGPRWREGHVEAPGGCDQVPHPGTSQRFGTAIERETLRYALREHACFQLAKRGGQPLEIRRVGGRRDVGIGGYARKALEPRRERTDKHISHVMRGEDGDDAFRIERGEIRHDAPPPRTG